MEVLRGNGPTDTEPYDNENRVHFNEYEGIEIILFVSIFVLDSPQELYVCRTYNKHAQTIHIHKLT